MWVNLLAILFSTSLWAAGLDYYHWKDLELRFADKDRLYINYQLLKDYHINFPILRLYDNSAMKGKPVYEFTEKGTLENGSLKCGIHDYDCQDGPIYKKPWSYRDSGELGVYLLVEREINDGIFEIKHRGTSYYLNISSLKDYKRINLKLDTGDHLKSKSYWVQKSHSHLMKQIKEKFPAFEVEKKKVIDCLRSKDTTCANKYKISESLQLLKQNSIKFSDVDPDSDYYKQLIRYDYTSKNVSIRRVLAACFDNGKLLTDFFTTSVSDMLTTSAEFYSPDRIDFIDGEQLGIECSIEIQTDNLGEVKSVQISFSHQQDV